MSESQSRRPDGLPGPLHPRPPEDFDLLYTGTPPWDIGRPQSAFLALAQADALRGRVLDVGCGTGEHALMAAAMGLAATGIDMAAAAIRAAERKATDRGLHARFLVWDALQLASLNEQFDTVLDSGLFHVLEDAARPRFVDGLRAVMPPGSQYFMLCVSDRQPGDQGPRRVSQEEIRASFTDGWTEDAIDPATIEARVNAVIVPNGTLG